MHGSMRRREAISASRASTRRAAGQTSRRPYTAGRREMTGISLRHADIPKGRQARVIARPVARLRQAAPSRPAAAAKSGAPRVCAMPAASSSRAF